MMSFKEAQEMGRRIREDQERTKKMMEETRRAELRKQGIDLDAWKSVKPKYDHPGTPDDGFVTVIYILGMVGSLIFKDFWMAWIVLTIGYGKFITRHNKD